MNSEKQTRKEIIDIKLKKAGWNVSDKSQVAEELDIYIGLPDSIKEPVTPYQGHQYSDYALLGKDGKPIAIVEAKKTSVDARVGQEQAKQYCLNIQKKFNCPLPFCFFTNGHDIYFWDIGNQPVKKVFGFPSRYDLERLSYIRNNKKSLTHELINTKIAGRDYQIKAIRTVLEGIEKNKRNFLLVMATGTGKTRTCIALVDALMRAGCVQRILFLVDRIALRNQALDAFKEHIPDEPIWPKEGENTIATDRRIYVSTYPTMLNIIKDEKKSLSPHFFDLVIVDESHRSIYNTYMEILNYFNSIKLGLTATPTDVIDHNTFNLFDCENGIPTFGYTYEDALNNIPPYLCDFQVLKIKTKFQESGINSRTIALEDQKKLIMEGREVEEIDFEGSDIEKNVTNRGTNALIVKEFMEECIKDPEGVLPGKTIFFCISKSHARRIEEIFNNLYPEYNSELAKVIISDDPRVYGKDGLLSQFINNDMPRVAISVDMLDTGIDVREAVNLVFVKQVFSYTKFWQMIGRGTRLLEPQKIKSWCQEKNLFLILDCWDNFEYFKLNPKGKEIKQQIALPVRLFGLRLDKLEEALKQKENDIVSKESENLKSLIRQLPKDSVVIMDNLSELQILENENFWVRLNKEKIEYLRNIVKPLMRVLSNVDFTKMKFEKDLVETSLALLKRDMKKFETLKEEIIEKISELPLSVNIIQKEKELILQSQSNHFWSNINDDKFDLLNEKLSPFMKYIESFTFQGSGMVKLDLKDIIYNKEIIEFGPQHESLGITKYRELVEQKINDMTSANPLLFKLKNGENITETEAEELAKMLYSERPNITLDLLRRVYKNQKAKFIQFIRHILGIEKLESFPESVTKAFDKFISEHSNLTSRQLEFLNLLKNFIMEHEKFEKKDLINSPFTKLHPKGIRGVFSTVEIDELVNLAQRLVA